jgi:Tfp pilus assembly protein PilV
MPAIHPSRHGFVIVEVIVAMFLIAIALGALEWSMAITIRRLRESHQESTAARLIQARSEWLLASPCGTSSGIDSSHGVVATWSERVDRHVLWIDQEAHYRSIFGEHKEAYRAAGGCQ